MVNAAIDERAVNQRIMVHEHVIPVRGGEGRRRGGGDGGEGPADLKVRSLLPKDRMTGVEGYAR